MNSQTEICPVSGLPVTRKPEWNYESEDGRYRVTFEQIGKNIVHSRSSGYAEKKTMLEVRKFSGNVKSEMFPDGKPYYTLNELSGVTGTSFEARRVYLNWMKEDVDHLLSAVYYGGSLSLNLLFKMGKTLSHKFHKAHIVKNYAGSIRLILEHQSGNLTEEKTERKHIQELMGYLTRMSWEGDLEQKIPILPEDDPFATLFAAVAATQKDLRTVAQERKQTEENLKQAKEFSESILEASPDASIVTDQSGKITLANRRAQNLFGYTKEEMLGQTVEMLIPQKLKNSHVNLRQSYYQHPRARPMGEDFELFGQHRNGQMIPVDIGLNIVQIEDEKFVIASVRDITEWRTVEVDLNVAKQQAEFASQAKSDFLANMSHEIRTPLNAIGGFSQILSKRAEKMTLPNEFKEYLDNISNSSQHLSELINNILDLAKIEAGKMETYEEAVNLKLLEQGIFNINSVKAREKKIDFSYKFDGDLPEQILTDRTKLNQILMNLIGNALKFTPENGSVQLSILLDTSTSSGPKILLQVKDSGIGIAANKLESVFGAFEQTDASTTRQFGGTGLGLAISKQMVELLGGSIAVESVEGEGTTFSVRLPLLEAQTSSGEDVAESALPQFAPESKVLVIDDDPLNQKMVAALFSDLGIEVRTAKDGSSGVVQALELRPELILMDVQMAGMDGFEATRKIRKELNQKEFPLIIFSAHAFVEHRKEAAQSGANDYLTKPLDFQKLIPVLRKYLRFTEKTPGTAETLPQLPEKQKENVRKLFVKITEIPEFRSLKMRKPLQQIQELCKGYDTSFGEQAKRMEKLILSGKLKTIPELLTKVLSDFEKQRRAS